MNHRQAWFMLKQDCQALAIDYERRTKVAQDRCESTIELVCKERASFFRAILDKMKALEEGIKKDDAFVPFKLKGYFNLETISAPRRRDSIRGRT